MVKQKEIENILKVYLVLWVHSVHVIIKISSFFKSPAYTGCLNSHAVWITLTPALRNAN